jgi:hypothetical protein
MRLLRALLTGAALALLAGVAYVGQKAEPAGARMSRAADKLLASLSADQKEKAVFDFDSPERTRWFFTPQQQAGKPLRKGLRLEDMTAEQKETARDLLAAGTSAGGDKKALTIMSLESILHDLEKNGAIVRDPAWYFFTIFGKPSDKGKWGWRVEGHHLSLNFVVDNAQVSSSTPAFFGANPAVVMAGPRKGLRTLPEAEDLAKKLYLSLDDDQKKAATRDKLFPEVPGEGKAGLQLGPPEGLAAEKMTEKQRAILMRLLEAYADRMPAEVAEAQLKQVKDAGVGKVHFVYAGGTRQGQQYTYRVQGPTFVIDFRNMQPDSAGNPANHIHSVWRSLRGDFGLGTKEG